jgi:hypothetical protein
MTDQIAKSAKQDVLPAPTGDGRNLQQIATSAIKLNVAYYQSVLAQAQQSFRAALFAAVIGLVFFIAAVALMLFRVPTDAPLLSLIAGALIEVIAGLNFYLYGRTTQQLSDYHRRLDNMLRYLLANSISESLPEAEKVQARTKLVDAIADLPREWQEAE